MNTPDKTIKSLKILIRYILPLILVGWMFTINPWGDFFDRVTGVSLTPLIFAIAINFGVIFTLKVYRWRMAIKNPPPFWSIYASQLEGQLANILIGMGVADLVRSSRLRKNQKGTFPEDLGTAMADRICEYISLSLLLAFASFTPWVSQIWIFAPILYISLVLLILNNPSFFLKRLSRFSKVCRAITTITTSLKVKHRMFFMVMTSFSGWLAEILMIIIVLQVLGLPSGFGLASMVLIAINVAIAIPSLPANIGTFEAGAVLALTASGIQSDAAVSFAIFYHGFHLISTSVVACAVLLYRNYKQPSLKEKTP